MYMTFPVYILICWSIISSQQREHYSSLKDLSRGKLILENRTDLHKYSSLRINFAQENNTRTESKVRQSYLNTSRLQSAHTIAQNWEMKARIYCMTVKGKIDICVSWSAGSLWLEQCFRQIFGSVIRQEAVRQQMVRCDRAVKLEKVWKRKTGGEFSPGRRAWQDCVGRWDSACSRSGWWTGGDSASTTPESGREKKNKQGSTQVKHFTE